MNQQTDLFRECIAKGKQIIYGNIPSKSNSYKIITIKSKKTGKVHGSLGKTQKLKKYEEDFIKQAGLYRNANLGEFEIYVDVFFPTRMSDLDNSLKILLDCLQKVNAIQNDNKCMGIVARRRLDPGSPRIEFELKPFVP